MAHYENKFLKFLYHIFLFFRFLIVLGFFTLIIVHFFNIIYRIIDYIVWIVTGKGIRKPVDEPRKINISYYDFALVFSLVLTFFWTRHMNELEKTPPSTGYDRYSYSSENNDLNYSGYSPPNRSVDTPTIPKGNENNYAVSKEKIDEPQKAIQDKMRDSVELISIKSDKFYQNSRYEITDKLPQGYYSSYNKYEFSKLDSLIKVDVYNLSNNDKINTFNCHMQNNIVNIENSSSFFCVSEGRLFLIDDVTHIKIQLAMNPIIK